MWGHDYNPWFADEELQLEKVIWFLQGYQLTPGLSFSLSSSTLLCIIYAQDMQE